MMNNKDEIKYMANGLRTSRFHILTEQEIEAVKREIQIIGADPYVFIFNDEDHQKTCYYPETDKIYIAGDVLPDSNYASNNTRDLMSIRAVLAHEYYGHRPHRLEYLEDIRLHKETIPYWQDEYRASYEAARYCPNLSDLDKYHLIKDAIDRGIEANIIIENDGFMKEVLYGYQTKESYYTEQPGIRNETPGNIKNITEEPENEPDLS